MTTSSQQILIKPYIPRKLSIDSQSRYLKFIKRKPKILPRLTLNDYENMIQCHPITKKFLKIAKQLKYVHDLCIQQFNYVELFKQPSKMLDFIKRMSKIKILVLRSSHGDRSKFSYFWPKYIKNLKTLSFDTPYLSYRTRGSYNVQIRHLRKVKSIRFISKYQNQLRDLEIEFSSLFDESQRDENLDLQFYCPSLRKLTLRGGSFMSRAPSTSFDHFKNLKALELYFGMRTSPEFLNSILCLLPKIPNLESLSFKCPDQTVPGLKDSFRSMKILTMLKSVRIYPCNLALSHSKVLLKVLENFPLKSLDLSFTTKNAKQVKLMLNLLERLTSLETLELENDWSEVWEPLIIQKIFQKVDNLHFLKHLSLKIYSYSKNQGEITIELPFSKLFTKSIPVETFRVSCDQVPISHQTFFDLLKSLKRRALYIKNLELGIGEIILDEKEFQKLLEILKNFSEIRVLELPMVGIHKKTSFMELVDTVWTMKSLRSLGVGKFYAPVVGTKFTQGIEKILSKHGLVSFDCQASKDFKENIRKKDLAIDWEKIRKSNPLFSRAYDLRSFFPEKKKKR